MAHPVRWGILGCGRIARKFADGLRAVDGAELVAAGSRTQSNADVFADEFSVPRRHGSYEDLAGDAGVDAIYVATPHPMHKDNSILCLEAGTPVLCEKPLTVNAEEGKTVVAVARSRGVFFMEAMWARFLPSLVRVRELLSGGVIGEVRILQADIGFRAPLDPSSRLFDPNLAGGALLDVGIYPVSLASMVFGSQPEEIAAVADIGETGVDEQTAMVFRYSGGAMAVLTGAVRADTRNEAIIVGTEGQIRLLPNWWGGGDLAVIRAGEAEERIETPMIGNGYNYEAEEVARCLSDELKESPILTLDESIALMETMDRVRAAIGLRYPME